MTSPGSWRVGPARTWSHDQAAEAVGLAPEADGSVWHTLSAGRVLQAEDVDRRRGLSSAEVTSRTQWFGPNAFATPAVPAPAAAAS